MARALSLTSSKGTVDLTGATRLRRAVKGFGLPPVEAQFFDGAGDGTTHRGTRVLPRVMDLPLKVTGADRQAVAAAFSSLARTIAPKAGPVRVRAEIAGEVWYTDATRVGGGDWDWDEDTDGSTIILTSVTLKSDDPYWTREDAESVPINLSGVGKGILKGVGTMSGMELSTTTAFGDVPFDNPGDVESWAVVTASAPFTKLTLTGPGGELVEWTGVKSSGFVVVDMEAGTIVDEAGDNLYGGLNDVPLFWAIEPGVSTASVVADDPTGDTEILFAYQPKKWVLF